MRNVKLNNGITMPMIGLGTYKITDEKVEGIIHKALELGYRHIDTASMYGNEKLIGRALKKTKIPREDIFITGKLNNDDQGYEECLYAFEQTLSNLGLQYLDMYLIHWPSEKSQDSWKAMEKLYGEGKIKSIGLSNFHEKHIDEINKIAKVKPVVNQYERHPYLIQNELEKVTIKNGMKLEAWSPIARGMVFNDSTLLKIAKKHNKTVAQVVLRWQNQSGYAVFPKTENLERLKENIDIFDFILDDKDMEEIALLDKGFRIGKDPESIEVLNA